MADDFKQRYTTEFYSKEVLQAQDGRVVPFKLTPGGETIGTATLHYEEDTEVLEATFQVSDPKVADFLRGDPPSIFGGG